LNHQNDGEQSRTAALLLSHDAPSIQRALAHCNEILRIIIPDGLMLASFDQHLQSHLRRRRSGHQRQGAVIIFLQRYEPTPYEIIDTVNYATQALQARTATM
jgi:hypothetical protein